jgi:hypothetical protein
MEGATVPRTKIGHRKTRKPAMPLLRFDLIEGRSESEIRKILDATHEVLLETLKVPKHDRYQVVHEHKRSRMTPVWDLSGLTACSCFKSPAAREAAR